MKDSLLRDSDTLVFAVMIISAIFLVVLLNGIGIWLIENEPQVQKIEQCQECSHCSREKEEK